MNKAELFAILARGEDSHHQFKRDFTNVETLASHAFYMLPYRGLGSGIPRATEAWPPIKLIDDRRGNQFKVVIRRLEIGQTKPESQPELQPLENRVLQLLAIKPASKAEISSLLGQKEVSGQLNKVIRELLAAKRIEYTIPNKPNSRLQQYRISVL
jgi:hypothetical protein